LESNRLTEKLGIDYPIVQGRWWIVVANDGGSI